MSAENSLLPVVLPADAGAARPFRRAAGFFLVAIGLPLIAYVLSAIGDGGMPGYAAAFAGIPAIAIAIIAGFHVLAGLMIWLGTPHRRETRAAQ
ncbi:MAG TPA: hypothetical protein VGO52_22525 [Hyphomonadaceae bacterium]|jgi:hypothetical protein|nr:hypothetical protein [Hyphomonadaceae bacterium]